MREAGVEPSRVAAIFTRALIAPVLTAHPTEVQRKSILDGQMSVTRFRRFDAIGSGGPYALGAMHTLFDEKLTSADIVRRGCAAALHFDISCGGELDVFTIKL